MEHGRILSLNVGMPEPLSVNAKGETILSSIRKKSVTEPIRLTLDRFEGDGQADNVHHGGPDKAVCVYSYDHYPYWNQRHGWNLPFGAFGENVTVRGLSEDQVCIGDIFRLGEATVQISQPRQPCFKLGERHGTPELVEQVVALGYTGYYYRVLEEGEVPPDAVIRKVDAHPLEIKVAEANAVYYHDRGNMERLERLLAVDALSDAWRASLTKRKDNQSRA